LDNGHEPATKQDVGILRGEMGTLRAEMKQDMVTLGTEMGTLRTEMKQDVAMLRSEMQHMHDALVERIADSETKLLKAFYTFAESNQQRLAQVETSHNAVIVRLATLETRITLVEKHLNLPPSA
jgi:hypothetical protein